jgi:hypothetical protein
LVGAFNVTLNGTLVVQAINFCIAYWLLRWLYLKPAIAQIHQEEAVVIHLKSTIVDRSLIIDQKKRQQKEYWLACQQHCQERMPSMAQPDTVSLQGLPALEQPTYDPAALRKMSDTITDVLVKRIDHVF